MADANRAKLIYRRSEADGTAIDPATEYNELPFNSESLHQTSNFLQSQEIEASRNIKQMVRAGIAAEGSVECEFGYAQYDDLIESALHSESWTSPHADVSGTDISVDVSGGDVEIRSATNEAFDAVAVGTVVRASGFDTAANNGLYVVNSVEDFDAGASETKNALAVTPLHTSPSTEAAGESVTLAFSAWLTNGTRRTLVDLEKEFTDVEEFAQYPDCEINSMSLSVELDAFITASFNLMGKREESASSTAASGGVTDAPDNKKMTTTRNVLAIVEGGSADDNVAFSLELENNLYARKHLGDEAPIGHGTGFCNVTGTLQRYFEHVALVNKYLNATVTSLWFLLQDDHGNQYAIYLPEVTFTEGQRVVGGGSTEVRVELSWQATQSHALGYTIRWHRLAG